MSICCSILIIIYVVVQFYPWFNFSFLLFLGMVMYDNEFQTKENKNWIKDKIEPQHIPKFKYYSAKFRIFFYFLTRALVAFCL